MLRGLIFLFSKYDPHMNNLVRYESNDKIFTKTISNIAKHVTLATLGNLFHQEIISYLYNLSNIHCPTSYFLNIYHDFVVFGLV